MDYTMSGNNNNNQYCKLSDNIDILISKHDIIISSLPTTMHIPIAKICIKCKTDRHLQVISSDMKKLNKFCNKTKYYIIK